MRSAAALLAGAVWLIGCAPTAAPPIAAETPDRFLIGAEGLGPVRVGMSIAQANAALGVDLVADEPLDDPDLCQTWHEGAGIEAPIYYMTQHGRITRVSANAGAYRVRTREGVGPGSTDAEVRAAYPNAIEQPAPYGEPPAHDLIVWARPDESGLRFEIETDGRVAFMHGGDDSILLIEGCA